MSLIGAGSSSSILAGATLYDGVPINLLANTNDLSVDPDTFSLLSLTSVAAVNLTGLAHSQTKRVVLLSNDGAFNITLVNGSVLSTADHRFNLGGSNIVLAPGDVVALLCQTRASGWVLLFSSTSPTAGAGTVESVSITVPDDFTASVATPTTTPAITITHGVVLPTVLAAGETDNLNPGGPFPVSIDRVDFDTTAGVATITGMVLGQNGQRIIARNIGANNVTFKNQNASSTAANRFSGAADLTLLAGGAAMMVYYAGSVNRWVLVP